jgi:hypothetical protein
MYYSIYICREDQGLYNLNIYYVYIYREDQSLYYLYIYYIYIYREAHGDMAAQGAGQMQQIDGSWSGGKEGAGKVGAEEADEEEEEEVFSVSMLSESRGYSAVEEAGDGRGAGFVTPTRAGTGTQGGHEEGADVKVQTAAWKRLGRVKKDRRAKVIPSFLLLF